MRLDWSIKTQHTGLKMGFGNLACLLTGAAAGSVLTCYNKPFPPPPQIHLSTDAPPPTVALYINILYTHTRLPSSNPFSFLLLLLSQGPEDEENV